MNPICGFCGSDLAVDENGETQPCHCKEVREPLEIFRGHLKNAVAKGRLCPCCKMIVAEFDRLFAEVEPL